MRFFFAKYISISDEGAVLSNATLCTARRTDRTSESKREKERRGERERERDTSRGYETRLDEGKVGGKG